ncbi:hypothetical protein [Photobacterium phosphoreum]|uniref:hypothetical protein n=1 Tax=Photobacterium phosphoreum TaxID=659 RepID=UPI0007F8852A|nr:hypothetical protein [Photobacterium phosphoreum]OBU35441.1 hypothetical protein AYY24_02520 [Photobacterium phosphoreum]PSW36523.1 hypothetical protein CTM87_11365 [Photobacterium phosphoreum]
MPIDKMTILFMVIAFLLGLLVRSFLPNYVKKKAENLATKEDIGDITQKIEDVKIDYATQLEETKAALMSRISTHSYRFEKEYEVLSQLTECLVEVRSATLQLRPIFDRVDLTESEDERKNKRLDRLYDARKTLFQVRETKRPFFTEDIYKSILEIDKTAHHESIGYELHSPNDLKRDYWEDAEKNQETITQSVEQAMTKIRERVRSWDALQ